MAFDLRWCDSNLLNLLILQTAGAPQTLTGDDKAYLVQPRLQADKGCESFETSLGSLPKARLVRGACTPLLVVLTGEIKMKYEVEYIPTRQYLKHILNNYQLTEIDYYRLLKQQNSRCAICRELDRLVVDHSHSCTGRHIKKHGCKRCVRALLCVYCNGIVGRIENPLSANIVKAAKDYLRRYK